MSNVLNCRAKNFIDIKKIQQTAKLQINPRFPQLHSIKYLHQITPSNNRTVSLHYVTAQRELPSQFATDIK
jgi:hypothetical protein